MEQNLIVDQVGATEYAPAEMMDVPTLRQRQRLPQTKHFPSCSSQR
jgi:hypothetical protein